MRDGRPARDMKQRSTACCVLRFHGEIILMTSPVACGFSLWAPVGTASISHTHRCMYMCACEDLISLPKGGDTHLISTGFQIMSYHPTLQFLTVLQSFISIFSSLLWPANLLFWFTTLIALFSVHRFFRVKNISVYPLYTQPSHQK